MTQSTNKDDADHHPLSLECDTAAKYDDLPVTTVVSIQNSVPHCLHAHSFLTDLYSRSRRGRTGRNSSRSRKLPQASTMLQFITRPLSALLLAALCCQQAPLASAQSGDLSPQLPSDLKQCSTVDLTWSATTNNGSSQMYYASIVSASARGLNGTDEVITYLARLNDTTNYEW